MEFAYSTWQEGDGDDLYVIYKDPKAICSEIYYFQDASNTDGGVTRTCNHQWCVFDYETLSLVEYTGDHLDGLNAFHNSNADCNLEREFVGHKLRLVEVAESGETGDSNPFCSNHYEKDDNVWLYIVEDNYEVVTDADKIDELDTLAAECPMVDSSCDIWDREYSVDTSTYPVHLVLSDGNDGCEEHLWPGRQYLEECGYDELGRELFVSTMECYPIHWYGCRDDSWAYCCLYDNFMSPEFTDEFCWLT